jgi:hypothetical protein
MKNPNIEQGSLNDKSRDNPKRRGWFIGSFIDDNEFLKTNNFEVKWGVHLKGEAKSRVISETSAKTISILISGSFLIKFPEIKQEILLSKTGDFVTYDAHEVYHGWECIEDGIVLTIRWPSRSLS